MASRRFQTLLGLAVACWTVESCTPSPRVVPGSTQNILSVTVGRQERKVLVYYPRNWLGMPLKGLVTFHGWHANPWADVVEYMNQTSYAERYGFALAIPFGTPTQGNHSPICCNQLFRESPALCAAMKPTEFTWDDERPCGWNSFPARSFNWSSSSPPDDVNLARVVAKLLVDEACVDDSKVFLMGFSGGATMANTLACTAKKKNNPFAGIAAVSGALVIPPALCNPSRQISYLSFVGTADQTSFPSHEERFALFVKKNGCVDVRRASFVTSTTSCQAVDGCPAGFYMEQCVVSGIGDQMPGHNRTIDYGPGSIQPLSNVDAVNRIFQVFTSLSAQMMTTLTTTSIAATVEMNAAPPMFL